MKKIFFCILAIFVLTFVGCKGTVSPSNKTEKESGDETSKKNEDYEYNETVTEISSPAVKTKTPLVNSESTYQSDEISTATEDGKTNTSKNTYQSENDKIPTPILTITAKKNGLEITKYHNPDWWYVDIHIYNKTQNVKCATITTSEDDNKDKSADTYFYPFVKAGETYKIYLTKQEKNYSNWASTENDAVEITAVGGDGNFFIKSDYYYYNYSTSTIIFKNLVFNLPEAVKENHSISGGIYDGGSWTGNSIWPENFTFDKSALNLTSGEIGKSNETVTKFLTGKDRIFVSLKLTYGIWNSDYSKYFSYSFTFIEDTIYDKSTYSNETIDLSGGIKIPSVYITSSSGNKEYQSWSFGSSWKEATIKIIDDDDTENLSETSIKIKNRGNSTQYPADEERKFPYSIKFSEKTKILGMQKSKKWALMANYFDRSLIRTDLVGYIGNEVFNSEYNPNFKSVNLYINGDFYGTYDIGEKITITKQRVNIQSLEDFAENSSDYIDVNGDGSIDINDAGFILEVDTFLSEKHNFYSSVYKLPINLAEPSFDDLSDDDAQVYVDYAKGKIDAFEEMLFADDFENHYEEYIDVNSFVDWYLTNEFSKNTDAIFQKSVYVYYNPEDEKLHMGPNWDFDLAFGNMSSDDCDNPKGFYIYGGKKWCNENSYLAQELGNGTSWELHAYWFNRLFESSSFKNAVKNRWNEKRIYLQNAINGKIVDYANKVYDYIPANEARLPRLGKYSWNGPSGYASRTEYEDEIYYLYNWCITRYNWMNAQITGW